MRERERVTLGSLFDGIGGFPLAASRAGITPVWASEVDKNAISITKRHFPEMEHLGDIEKMDGTEIQPVDVITFGSPCQDLSIAGKREGLGGERSALFFEAIRVISEMRRKTDGRKPGLIVWENVYGVFSSNRGRDFQNVLEEIVCCADAGVSLPRFAERGGHWPPAGAVVGDCYSVAWRVLDAQYWGVPQRRRRIFLVADFRGQSAGGILFKPESLQGDFEESGKKRQDATADVVHSFGARKNEHGINSVFNLGSRTDRVQINAKVAVTLTGGGGGGVKTGLYCLPIQQKRHTSGGFGVWNEGDPAFEIDTSSHRQAVFIGKSFGGYEKDERASPTRYCQHKGTDVDLVAAVDCRNDRVSKVSGALQAKDKGYSLNYINPLYNGYAVRRLTPVECERLQGFPDNWTAYGHDGKAISDSARYKALGNSVAIPCVQYIMNGIAKGR